MHERQEQKKKSPSSGEGDDVHVDLTSKHSITTSTASTPSATTIEASRTPSSNDHSEEDGGDDKLESERLVALIDEWNYETDGPRSVQNNDASQHIPPESSFASGPGRPEHLYGGHHQGPVRPQQHLGHHQGPVRPQQHLAHQFQIPPMGKPHYFVPFPVPPPQYGVNLIQPAQSWTTPLLGAQPVVSAPKARSAAKKKSAAKDVNLPQNVKLEPKLYCTSAAGVPPCEPKPAALMTSLEVFSDFVTKTTRSDGTVEVDTSGILSRECYLAWLSTRKQRPLYPEETFRKTIIAHITISDRASMAFPPEIEASLLIELRKKRVWPCFVDQVYESTGKPVNIGLKGVRTSGHHEMQRLKNGTALKRVSSSESEGDHEASKRQRPKAKQQF